MLFQEARITGGRVNVLFNAMDTARFEKPIHVGCGTIFPVRCSRLAGIYHYEYDADNSPRRVDDKVVALNCIVITTRGSWQLQGRDGKIEVDQTLMPLGVLGDGYGCRHNRGGNATYIATLAPDALDPDYGRLFGKSAIPSTGALQLVARACQAESDDAFDSTIFTLFNEASSLSAPDAQVAFSKLRVQRAKRFIEFNAFEQIRLNDVATEIGLSPFTTLRQFRQVTGITPHAYLLEIRLERAKQLLRDPSIPIQSVGVAAGFLDAAYFSRFFKSRTGLSPTDYRSAIAA